MPWCFGGSRLLPLLGGSKLEKEQIPKTTITFRVQFLVFSHCIKNAYNIVRDFQRMLLTNFSFRHEPLSWVFISFVFLTLSPFLRALDQYGFGKKIQSCYSMRITACGTTSITLMFHHGITWDAFALHIHIIEQHFYTKKQSLPTADVTKALSNPMFPCIYMAPNAKILL